MYKNIYDINNFVQGQGTNVNPETCKIFSSPCNTQERFHTQNGKEMKKEVKNHTYIQQFSLQVIDAVVFA